MPCSLLADTRANRILSHTTCPVTRGSRWPRLHLSGQAGGILRGGRGWKGGIFTRFSAEGFYHGRNCSRSFTHWWIHLPIISRNHALHSVKVQPRPNVPSAAPLPVTGGATSVAADHGVQFSHFPAILRVVLSRQNVSSTLTLKHIFFLLGAPGTFLFFLAMPPRLPPPSALRVSSFLPKVEPLLLSSFYGRVPARDSKKNFTIGAHR